VREGARPKGKGVLLTGPLDWGERKKNVLGLRKTSVLHRGKGEKHLMAPENPGKRRKRGGETSVKD